MKHRSLEEISQEADVRRSPGLSRRERLERWATLLERQPTRCLAAINGTEFGTRREQEAKRADDSPLTVALEDPVLRREGLEGDRVGDAVRFFDLSHHDVHHLVCYCHHGSTVAPRLVAARVRGMARRGDALTLRPRAMVVGGMSAAAVLGVALLAL
jgi:hypothetical protein